MKALSLRLNIPIQGKYIPFASIGFGYCNHNAGVGTWGLGVKALVRDRLGIRIEYRLYSWGEGSPNSLNSLFGGVSYFF